MILKKLREEEGLKQKELAEILNVSQNAIYQWEHEKCEPDIATLIKIANYFDVSLDKLCERSY